jgi:hypothetical protein
MAAHPVRPRADFVFDAPRRVLPPTKNPTGTSPAPSQPRTEPSRVAVPPDTESIAVERLTSPAPIADDRVSTPDPFAMALAAAVRWTSSDPEPLAPMQRAHAAVPVRPAARSAVVQTPRESPPPATPAPTTRGRATGGETAPTMPTPAMPTRAIVPAPRQTPAGAPRATPPSTERFTGIHIGAVDVQILPPPDPVKPPAAAPAASRPKPATASQLARGLTSSIGLRQS